MDYLGWELERQRAALAALLLGGGKAPDGESALNSERRSPPEGRVGHGPSPADTAWDGRSASDAETVRTAGQYRKDEAAETVETPVSAWEAVLGGEAARAVREGRDGGGTGTAGMPASAWEMILDKEAGAPVPSGERPRVRPGGGTGAQPEFQRPSGGYSARRGIRRTEANLAAEIQGAGSGESGVGDNAVSSKAGVNQGSVAAGHPERFLKIRRGGESTADMPGPDEPAAAGPSSWGGWGTAALRAEEGAKLLSRAVQRDARRYDGGFNIF